MHVEIVIEDRNIFVFATKAEILSQVAEIVGEHELLVKPMFHLEKMEKGFACFFQVDSFEIAQQLYLEIKERLPDA